METQNSASLLHVQRQLPGEVLGGGLRVAIDDAVEAAAALAQAHLVVAVMAFHLDLGFGEQRGEVVA